MSVDRDLDTAIPLQQLVERHSRLGESCDQKPWSQSVNRKHSLKLLAVLCANLVV